MNKHFDYDHALKMLDVINNKKKVPKGMITQACFIIGYPGSGDDDIDRTMTYTGKMIRHGLDEIAIFAFCPTPGSGFWKGDISPENVNFSSTWNKEGKKIREIRRDLVILFYIGKFWYSPIKTTVRFFRTKTWMTLKRMGLGAITKLWNY
jgi:radical SAM superfamily enzyme YgiQ (UPF0313 family)